MDTDPKTSQFIEQQLGTRYPYLDVQKGAYSRLKGWLAPLNPLALQQVPSPNRMSFLPRNGRKSHAPDPLPNPVRFGGLMPSHYDALGDASYQEALPTAERESSGTRATFALQHFELPAACARYLHFYRRCALVNGGERCGAEEREFLEVCPNFALNELRLAKLFKQKAKLVQREEYRRAVEVSPYNRGRSVADFDDRKRWVDGTAARLRPDTMWNDDRYAGVTQADVDAAKRRVAERRAATGYVVDRSLRHPRPISTEYETVSIDTPMYP